MKFFREFSDSAFRFHSNDVIIIKLKFKIFEFFLLIFFFRKFIKCVETFSKKINDKFKEKKFPRQQNSKESHNNFEVTFFFWKNQPHFWKAIHQKLATLVFRPTKYFDKINNLDALIT